MLTPWCLIFSDFFLIMLKAQQPETKATGICSLKLWFQILFPGCCLSVRQDLWSRLTELQIFTGGQNVQEEMLAWEPHPWLIIEELVHASQGLSVATGGWVARAAKLHSISSLEHCKALRQAGHWSRHQLQKLIQGLSSGNLQNRWMDAWVSSKT